MNKVFAAVAAILMGMGVQAQTTFTPSKDVLTTGVRCGVDSYLLKSNLSNQSGKIGPAVGLDLNYKRFFTPKVGFVTGINLTLAHSGLNLSGINAKTESTIGNKAVVYTYDMSNCKESYTTVFAELPLQLALQGQRFFGNVGFKLAAPLYTQGRFDNSGYSVSAYLPQYGTTIAATESQYGCGTYDGDKGSKDATYVVRQVYVFAACEVGMHFPNKKYATRQWGISLYADYALNRKNVEGNGNPFISVTGTNPSDVQMTQQLALGSSFIEKVGYLNAGLRLTFDFGEPAQVFGR